MRKIILEIKVGGLIIPWYLFGSNGEEKADFSRGVYLNNLKNPSPHSRLKIKDCLLKNFEILTKNNINMEEYLTLYHLYTEYKNLLNEQSQRMVYEYLKIAFNIVISEDMRLRYAELFLIEVPYLIKHGMDRETIKNFSLKVYELVENQFLKHKSYRYASILRANKKWLDIL